MNSKSTTQRQIFPKSNVGVTTVENEDPENNYLKSLQWQTPILNKSYQVKVTGQRWPYIGSGGSGGTWDPNWESTSSGVITNPIIFDTVLIKEGDEYHAGDEVAVDSGEEIIVEAKAKDGGDAIENSAITIFWNLKDPEPQNLDAGSLSSSSSTTDSTGMATATLTCSTSGGDDHIVAGQDKSSDPASSCDSGKAIVGGQAQPALSYIYNQDNQLLFEGDGTDTTSYAYDANGNLTRKTDPSNNVTTYAYDYENRLTQSLRTGGEAISISYAYDANGNRTSKTENSVTTHYINDPNGPMIQVLQERDGSNNLIASYTYGNDLISQTRSSNTSYYLYDGLGSARILTDSSGDVLNIYTYDSFGNPVFSDISTANNYCFTGEQLDGSSSLYYLRARYYDPAVGRFISRDPILSPIQIKNTFAWALPYLIYQPQILNPYNYCRNNPVNLVDPRGLTFAPVPGTPGPGGIMPPLPWMPKKLADCVNNAYARGGRIPWDPKDPTAGKAHCYVSCEINLCFGNLLPWFTLGGVVWAETEDWKKDSWSDILYDVKGIIVSYNPFRSCAKDCDVCPK